MVYPCPLAVVHLKHFYIWGYPLSILQPANVAEKSASSEARLQKFKHCVASSLCLSLCLWKMHTHNTASIIGWLGKLNETVHINIAGKAQCLAHGGILNKCWLYYFLNSPILTQSQLHSYSIGAPWFWCQYEVGSSLHTHSPNIHTHTHTHMLPRIPFRG